VPKEDGIYALQTLVHQLPDRDEDRPHTNITSTQQQAQGGGMSRDGAHLEAVVHTVKVAADIKRADLVHEAREGVERVQLRHNEQNRREQHVHALQVLSAAAFSLAYRGGSSDVSAQLRTA